MTVGDASPGGVSPRLFALLGDPVEHSASPAIHGAAFRERGVTAVYAVVETRPAEVEPVMRALSRRGGGNVTLPHKGRAARALDRPTAAVSATGACNCFWSEGGELVGDNTDVEGFLAALEGLIPGGGGPAGGRVLLLGAGGGARAALHGLLEAGAARVDVWNRTRDRARRMREEVAGGAEEVRVLGGREEIGARYDLVVNATSLGLDPDDPLPLSLEGREVGAVFDLVYGEAGTSWVRHARELGIPARDGLEMLVRQAAASLERWMEEDPPLEAMREAARRATGRDGG